MRDPVKWSSRYGSAGWLMVHVLAAPSSSAIWPRPAGEEKARQISSDCATRLGMASARCVVTGSADGRGVGLSVSRSAKPITTMARVNTASCEGRSRSRCRLA